MKYLLPLLVAIWTSLFLEFSSAGDVEWVFQGTLRNTEDWSGHFPSGAPFTLKVTLDDAAPDNAQSAGFGSYQNFVSNVELSVPAANFVAAGQPGFNRFQIDLDGTIGGEWDARFEIRLDSPLGNLFIQMEWVDRGFRTLTDDTLGHPFTDPSAFHYVWINIEEATSPNFTATAAFTWLRPKPGGTAPAMIQKRGYKGMYIFGDSLSATTDPLLQPDDADKFFEGGYTNGPVWVQHLAWRLGIPFDSANNFSQFLFPFEFGPEDFAGEPVSKSLFIQWSNTPLFAAIIQGQFNAPGTPEAARSRVASQMANSRELLDAVDQTDFYGGRNLLIIGVGDVTFAPFVQLLVPPEAATALRAFVDATNAQYGQLLSEFRGLYPNIASVLVDPNQYLDPVKATPQAFGITNITHAAIDGDPANGIPPVSVASADGPGSDFFFWTGTAPTTRVHCYLADFIFDDVFATGMEGEDDPYLHLVDLSPDRIRLVAGNLLPNREVRFFKSESLPVMQPESTFTPGDPCRLIDLPRDASTQQFFWLQQ